MLGGLFKSVGELARDVAEVALTPVEIAADLAGAVVKPVAEVARELKADIKGLKE